MKYFVIFLVLIGFTSFAYADEIQPKPEDFRNNTGFVIDISTLYDDEEIFPTPLAPLKQVTNEIKSENIQCKSKLHLIIKHDGTPVCVTSKTAAKLTDKTQRKGWLPSEQLITKLGEKILSISEPSSCPSRCISLEPTNTLTKAEKITSLRVDLPRYIPEGYEYFKFFAQENSLSVQILPKPLPEHTTWGEFYLIEDGIFITFVDNPITTDGRAKAAYWAKTHNAHNNSPPEKEPVFVRERTITFDENLDLLFLGFPSEAQFSLDNDTSVIITGYVPQKEIILIVNSLVIEN